LTRFKVALAQVSASCEKLENLKRGVELIRTAAERGADLLVLPELFMAYSPLDMLPAEIVDVAERVDGEFISALAAETRKHRMHVAVGILEKSRKNRDKAHNTVVMLGPDGRVISKHRKLQLFDSFGYRESSRFEPGSDIEGAFKTRLAKMGLMTCYELRFPEMARILALQGAELIVVPTAWVAGRMKEDHLHILARARALENTVFLAVASQTGRIFTGRSVVVDPFGVSICDAGEEECLVTADIDLDRIKRVRKLDPSLRNIRSDVYAKYRRGAAANSRVSRGLSFSGVEVKAPNPRPSMEELRDVHRSSPRSGPAEAL
jgi:predicted amidohydrolase